MEGSTLLHFLSLLILALAVSLDSFGVGITYGLRQMRIPLRSILIVAICSGTTLLLAMGVGQTIANFISPYVAEVLGGIILIGIGLWALSQVYRSSKGNQAEQDEQPAQEKVQDYQTETCEERKSNLEVWTLELKKFGIIVQILKKPLSADFDRSGTITSFEAFILGLALSLDAFGAGIGAALLGYPALLTALFMALMSSLFLLAGLKVGRVFANIPLMTKLSYLPGLILIAFGVFRLL